VPADAKLLQTFGQGFGLKETPPLRPCDPHACQLRQIAERLGMRNERLAEEEQLANVRKRSTRADLRGRDDTANGRIVGQRIEVDRRLADSRTACREHLFVPCLHALDGDEMAGVADVSTGPGEVLERQAANNSWPPLPFGIVEPAVTRTIVRGAHDANLITLVSQILASFGREGLTAEPHARVVEGTAGLV